MWSIHGIPEEFSKRKKIRNLIELQAKEIKWQLIEEETWVDKRI